MFVLSRNAFSGLYGTAVKLKVFPTKVISYLSECLCRWETPGTRLPHPSYPPKIRL